MEKKKYTSKSEDKTIEIGIEIGSAIKESLDKLPLLIFLRGNLGTGKTTLTKGILQGLGSKDLVKSPTFNLVEIYEFDHIEVNHFDLYRIESSNELDEIGIRSSLTNKSVLSIIEWPEKFLDFLPNPHINIELNHYDSDPDVRIIEINYLRI